MEKMWIIISNIAAILSIISAIISFIQVVKAKKIKKETERIKNIINEKFNVYINSQLLTDIHNILGELNKNRKKPFNNNPLMISQKLYNSVSFLLVTIRSQGIYEEAEVKKAVSKCEQIIKNLNAQDFTNQISDLLGNLSDIARYIDVSQRRI